MSDSKPFWLRVEHNLFREQLLQVQEWAHLQPERYAHDVTLQEPGWLLRPKPDIDEFLLLTADLTPIAYASLHGNDYGEHNFGMVTPARPQLRTIIHALQFLERFYFEQMHGNAVFVDVPTAELFNPNRRLALAFGWQARQAGDRTFIGKTKAEFYGQSQ